MAEIKQNFTVFHLGFFVIIVCLVSFFSCNGNANESQRDGANEENNSNIENIEEKDVLIPLSELKGRTWIATDIPELGIIKNGCLGGSSLFFMRIDESINGNQKLVFQVPYHFVSFEIVSATQIDSGLELVIDPQDNRTSRKKVKIRRNENATSVSGIHQIDRLIFKEIENSGYSRFPCLGEEGSFDSVTVESFGHWVWVKNERSRSPSLSFYSGGEGPVTGLEIESVESLKFLRVFTRMDEYRFEINRIGKIKDVYCFSLIEEEGDVVPGILSPNMDDFWDLIIDGFKHGTYFRVGEEIPESLIIDSITKD